LDVGRNKVGSDTEVVLFNSYNFDFAKLKILKEKFSPLLIHRVDGPISTYRGEAIDIDNKIWQMNHALADKTVFQSKYSLDKHLSLGLEFTNPSIIYNAADPEIFHSSGRISSPNKNRKTKLIATSWSDNPKKGSGTLAWLDEHLDHTRFELTFVGRTQATFHQAKIIPPVASRELAEILRNHDIYLAPSQDDPCSNALIEALTCGLPAVFRKSGGHPELVGHGGEGFNDEAEMLEALDKVAENYELYQSKLAPPRLEEVVNQYLTLFQ
jgi:glycosyltransferase involved in cell wall biosynthesis